MGNPKITQWVENYDRQVLFNRLKKVIVFTDKGKVSPANIKFDFYTSILNSMIELKEYIPEQIKNDIIYITVTSLFKNNKLSAESFIKMADDLFVAYLKSEQKSYYLTTSISFDNRLEVRSSTIKTCKIDFLKKLPAKLSLERKKVLDNQHTMVGCKYPYNYLNVRVKTSGRSIYEAAEKALEAINIYRGIWNFNYNRRVNFSITDPNKPLNRLLLGPIHTLHHIDYNLATEQYWYEPDYSRSYGTIKQSEDFKQFYQFKNKTFGRIRRSGLQKIVENLLIQYTNAFDSKDSDSTFIKLWNVLENLTISKDEKTKNIITRTLFLSKDPDLSKLTLTHLRGHRNTYAHSGSSKQDSTIAVFQLKEFVDGIILFVIENKFNLKTKDDLKNFLDHPRNPPRLQEKIDLAKKAMRYISSH